MSKGNEHREENNSMNPTLLKILLPVIAVAGVGCIGYGVYTLQNAKESEVQQAATQIEIQVGDNTQIKTETEKQIEKALEQQAQRNQQVSKPQQQSQKPVQQETVTQSQETQKPVQTEQQKPVVVKFEVKEVTPQKMYATTAVNLRQGPNQTDFAEVGTLYENEEVTVVGVVDTYRGETCLWYYLETGEFVNGAYLSLDKVVKQTSTPKAEPETYVDETPNGYSGAVINPETGNAAQPGDSWEVEGWGEVYYGGDI